MSLPKRVNGLMDVKVHPTERPTTVVFDLFNTDGKVFSTAVNPDSLRFLLMHCLGLASRWAEETDLEISSWAGPQHALPATHVELATGRSSTECALRVFVGPVEMTFLLPMEVMVNATRALGTTPERGTDALSH